MGILELLVLIMLLAFLRTWWVQNSKEQKEFLKGKVPQKMDGFYQGTIEFPQTMWLGKVFNSKNSTGINRLADGDKYFFKTYIAKGLQDKNKEVLRLDYNLKTNPWWIRWIVDEVVEIGKDKLLGKGHLKILPGVVFSIAYFRLES